MTMPQTRHYEMKDSGVEWIGPMPSHWSAKRLKYVARSLAKGNGITKDETFVDGDTPCIRYGEIYTRYNQSFTECVTRTNKDIISSPRYFSHGDILFTCTGELVEEIGKSVAYLGSEECMAGGDIIVLKHTQNASFLNYALNCNYAQAQKSCDKAKLKVVHISAFDIGNIILAFPPLSEQTAIAAYLDEKCATIDAIIAEAKASIEEYKSWKASVIFETVTKGLNPNAEMKDSGVEWIGEIPGGWAVERLKAMFSFGKGLPITKEDLVEQGIPVISYGQIHAKFNTGVEVLPQLLRYVDAKWLESNANSLVSEGDFIFADTSEDMEGCGNCVYVDTLNEGAQLFAGYHTITFKPKRSKHNKFLAYLFKSDAWRTQLRSRVGGVKLFSISRRMLNLATVILPPQNEQTAIAAYLDSKCAAIDGIILEKEDLIRELENYKRSLIFEVVTGKRRVC